MRRRCENPKAKDYPKYGGQGIRVCARWMKSFAAFLADVGLKPSPDLTLERIDNEKGYEPGNVRWATWTEQYANKRPMRWKKPYWRKTRDEGGVCYLLVIPKKLPPDWRLETPVKD
jgi:hypothetical protein